MNKRKLFQRNTSFDGKILIKKSQKSYCKNSKGITLIALGISLLVMLILAGVSLNATKGDNGIITQAQNAKSKAGMSALEEFLQQKYIEKYDEFDEKNNKDVILRNSYPDFFYSPKIDDNVGNKNYIQYTTVNDEGNNVTYQLYLLKKTNLPNEIKENLIGGEASGGGYANYAGLIDVYGITSDLKVFYCSNGWKTMSLLDGSINFNKEQQTQVVYEKGSASGIYSAITKALGVDNNTDITLGDLNNIKELKVDSECNSLKDLYNLNNLEILTIENANLSNLNGIENASKLYRINLYGSIVEDYTSMSKLGFRLNRLDVYNINDNEFDKLCKQISNAEFSNLKYLGVTGNLSYMYTQDTNSYATKSEKTITSTVPFSYLSKTTKESVKYLSIHCNNIVSLDGLRDFTNLITIRANHNQIETLDGLEKMQSLVALMCYGNNIGKNESETEKNSENDSLKVLKNLSNLKTLDLRKNLIVWIDYIKGNGNTYNYLYLLNNTRFNSDAVTAIVDIYYAAKTVWIDDKYLPYLSSTEVINYKDMNLTDTSPKIENLKNMSEKNKLEIKSISLSGNSELSNECINQILKGMNNLIAIDLTGLKKMNSIEFIKNMKNLKQLYILNTNVTDLSELENITTIKGIEINNTNIDLKKIQKTISRCMSSETSRDKYYTTEYITLRIMNQELTKKLEECTEITYFYLGGSEYPATLDLSKYSFSCYFKLTGTVTYTLPKNIDNLYVASTSVKISNSELTIKNFTTHTSGYSTGRCYDLLFSESLNKDISISNVNMVVCDGGNITKAMDLIKNVKNMNALTITHCSHQGTGIYIDDFEKAIKELTTLKKLSITWVDFNNLKGIENLKNLTELTVAECKIYDLTPLENLTNLTKLSLNDNSISKLVGLENLKKLTYLDLKNNSIDQNYAIKDDKGNEIVKNNLEILANLNPANGGSLTKILITGNSNITDYSILTNLQWSDGLIY